jgi:hypothetical protein
MSEDFPAKYPAKDVGFVEPGAAQVAEQARLKALTETVAAQKKARGSAPSVEFPDDADISKLDVPITSVKGYVSQAEADLGRLQKGLAFKERRREEFQRDVVNTFLNRRDFIGLTAVAAVTCVSRRRA